MWQGNERRHKQFKIKSILTTWTWANVAERNAQQVTVQDLGKIGYQTDTHNYCSLRVLLRSLGSRLRKNPANYFLAVQNYQRAQPTADSYHDFLPSADRLRRRLDRAHR